jgi:hypothetical protein
LFAIIAAALIAKIMWLPRQLEHFVPDGKEITYRESLPFCEKMSSFLLMVPHDTSTGRIESLAQKFQGRPRRGASGQNIVITGTNSLHNALF